MEKTSNLKEEAIDDTKHVEIPRMFLVKCEGQLESNLWRTLYP